MLSFRIRILSVIPAVLMLAGSCGSRRIEAEQPESKVFESVTRSGVPVLVDLGSNSCTPCRLMAEELAMLDSLTGTDLEVMVIDVNEDPDAASEFGVRLIPLQVFISEDGEELFRHEGFISCEDMLIRWEALGYTFQSEE